MILIYFSPVPLFPSTLMHFNHTPPASSSLIQSLTPNHSHASPTLPLQSPSTWASKSARAPDPPMRLGCEGAEPAGPGGGGAGTARGGPGLRLPGPPGWALPALLHPRGVRRLRGLQGRGVPPLHGGWCLQQ